MWMLDSRAVKQECRLGVLNCKIGALQNDSGGVKD